jgi:hypothetical protein
MIRLSSQIVQKRGSERMMIQCNANESSGSMTAYNITVCADLGLISLDANFCVVSVIVAPSGLC